MSTTKTCTKCEISQSLDNFCKSKRTKDGLNTICKTCDSTRRKELRVINKDTEKPKREIIPVETKICSKCKITKDIKFFGKDKSQQCGYGSQCKECKSKTAKKRIEKLRTLERSELFEKKCNICKLILPIDQYAKDCNTLDGYNSFCKSCRRDRDKDRKEYNLNNPIIDEVPFTKICTKCNIEKDHTEYNINRKTIDNRSHICIDCTPKSTWTKEQQRASEKKYKEKNINHQIRAAANSRIHSALQNANTIKDNFTLSYLGCKITFLKAWIESQFVNGMTWENHGEWEYDHVKPCIAYDLSIVEEQYKCFNWKNVQPLWRLDNIQKSGKIDYNLIKHHRIKANKFEYNYLFAENKESELRE
jgi:hypothetical protein